MGVKITELINNSNNFSFSFEVTPEVDRNDLENLKLEPLFYSITWHAKSLELNIEDLECPPLHLADFLRKKQNNVLIHLSCDKLKREYLNKLLEYLQNKETCNLLLVKGEGYDPSSSDYKTTSDLISYVRQITGTYFCIGVVGHTDKNDRYQSLKQKVDAGADFILTQAFFDTDVYKTFVNEIRQMNINIPIIPGLFPFETRQELDAFISLCKVNVNQNMMEHLINKTGLSAIKDIATKMFNTLNVKHFHLFTLNRFERTVKTIQAIEFEVKQ